MDIAVDPERGLLIIRPCGAIGNADNPQIAADSGVVSIPTIQMYHGGKLKDTIVGCVAMVSLGLMIAARVTSEELAGGLLNMISWPMMILSGVWFSLESAGQAVQNQLESNSTDRLHPLHFSTVSWHIPPL